MLSTREGFRGEEHFEAIECQARNWVPCKVFTPDNSAQLGVARCALTIIHKATSLECRLGTFNAQRSTLNFQCGDRKGALWPGYGDRHEIWTTGLLTRLDPTTRRSDGGGGLGAQIWEQTRCPMYRSGKFNVKRSTLNFQWADRKGAWWRGYGDRHGVLPVSGANRGTGTIFGPDWMPPRATNSPRAAPSGGTPSLRTPDPRGCDFNCRGIFLIPPRL